MGIDVRAYAQKGENIVRSSCVGCGICSSVCPRGVLRLENGPVAGRTATQKLEAFVKNHHCVKSVVDVIIPAFNEAAAIGKVIAALPNSVREIVVADNGSTDGTSGVAQQHGATVVTETQKGYGHACLKAMAYIEKKATPGYSCFLDGDFSDYPEELPKLVAPSLLKKQCL